MSRKFLAWDIEIFNEIPEGTTDWKALMPLGISCAATLLSDEPEPKLWHAADKSRPMNPDELGDLVNYLACHSVGMLADYTIVTHNGTSFDWHVLAMESQLVAECKDLAMNSIDSMFHFFCIKGYPIGLDAVAKGCGLPGKTEGMDGAKAPQMWQAGEYDKVLEYVGQDVITTLKVAQTVERQRGFSWTAKSGRTNFVHIPGWRTVAEALTLPEPDTSWMSDPWPRSMFTEWMNA